MAAAGGNSGEEDRAAAAAVAGLEFSCKYCSRKFRSKHALGGHQNAHRMERAMDWTVKRRRYGGFLDYYPFSPFAGFPPLPGAGAGGQMNYWYQAAASMPPYFRPGHPIPSPEIPPAPVPETPPVENHSPHAQVSPPAMTVSGASTFPGGSVLANNSAVVTPSRPAGSIVINSNPMNNTPEIIEDGELDLTLKI